ncbi:Tol-Pal system protein TolQ [Alphaproteobacteria bacterium SO-S41]|nr:Tol-Pal system protein TolQ [Alphaproteobacteria bacterium SO-S41]
MDLAALPDQAMHFVNHAGHVFGALADFVQAAPDPGAAPRTALPPVAVDTVGPQTTAATDAFSFIQLFLKADVVGKGVMILLIGLSFVSWAIIVEKYLRLRSLDAKAEDFEQVFWSGRSLDELYNGIGLKPDHPFAVVFVASMREWRRNFEGATQVTAALGPSIRDRIDRVMNVTIYRETSQVEKQLGFLATVGATAPFIGLFGTVWGIMNAFRGIAASNDTSLAVVAPGIAEALFATALGLLAAIPAVIAYNRFIAQANHYAGRLEGFADEFSAILSRQLDERSK